MASNANTGKIQAKIRQKKLTKLREHAAAISDIASSYAKVSYLALVVVGVWFLMAYTIRVGAPMPAADASLLMFIAMFAAWGLVALVASAVMLTLPAYARFWLDDEMKATFPGLFQLESPPSLKKALAQYALAFLPFLIVSAEFGRYFVFYVDGGKNEVFGGPFLAILLSALLSILLWSTLNAQKPLKALMCAGGMNLASLGWVGLLWTTFVNVAGDLYSDSDFSELDRLKLVVAAFMLAYIAFHFLLNLRQLSGRQWVGPAIFSMFLLIVVAGPSFFGAVSLRLLGYGGGIHVHLTERASNGTVLFEDDVCLVLRTGKETMYTESEKCGSPFKISQDEKRGRIGLKVTTSNTEIRASEKKSEQTKPNSQHS